jgi:4-diphosphocytidyl-2C-methyl-D-erythritol kinase
MMTRQTELEKDELIAELESDFALAEQSINDLTSTCRKQAGQIADLVDALKKARSHLNSCTMGDGGDLYVIMDAEIEAAEGKQVTK